MGRTLTGIALGMSFLVWIAGSHGDAGCMARSRRAYHCNEKDGSCCLTDYKRLHYVECSCPCWRYQHDFVGNRCLQCEHFRKPTEYELTYSNSNEGE